MLTGVTEEDWMLVVRKFQAVRSRRGEKGRDYRRFLAAVHYFTVRNISWWTLPRGVIADKGYDAKATREAGRT